MKALILDFCRRWRWILILYALLSLIEAAAYLPFAFTPLALVCLVYDAQRGVFRALRPLPISRREQALTWWIIGVPLFAALALPPLILGTLLRSVAGAPPANVAPWFMVVTFTWVALGYGALCFLLTIALPTRPARTMRENIEQGLVGLLFGTSFPGLMLLVQMLPQRPEAIVSWHVATFCAAPVLVVLSFLAAPDLLSRRTALMPGTWTPSLTEARAHRGGLTGVPLFLCTFGGRLLLLLSSIVAFQWLFVEWMTGGRAKAADSFLPFHTAAMAMIFGAIAVEGIGIRMLRILPVSTTRLAALLLSIAALLGIATAFGCVFFGDVGSPGAPFLVNVAAQALAITGCCGLALAIILYLDSAARIVVLMLLTILPVAVIYAAKWPGWLALAGLLACAGAYLLLHRGLRKSSAYYQPRRFFGITVGQPAVVR